MLAMSETRYKPKGWTKYFADGEIVILIWVLVNTATMWTLFVNRLTSAIITPSYYLILLLFY